MERGVLEQKPIPVLAKLKQHLADSEFLRPSIRVSRRATRMVSVVIPAHNEEAYLDSTLDHLARQTYKKLEVIVVANGCTDRTAEVAHGRCTRLIVLSRKSLGVARNLGARMANGEILVFLDADTLLAPNAIAEIAEEFRKDYAAGTIRGKPDDPAPSYRVVYFLKNAVHRLRLHPGSSGVIICWRDQFFKVGGFDEGLEVRENSELMKRLMAFGKYKYLPGIEAVTSMRRFSKKGLWRVTWLWIRVALQSNFGDIHRRRYEIVR